MTDPQLVEIAGRNWLTSELLQAGLEVARPERDRGIDLIAYRDLDKERKFRACPIQLKAATGEVFGLDPKYERFPGLVLVYVWHLGDRARTKCFALTYSEVLHVADEMGWTKTDSWITGGRNKKRGYSTTAPSERLKKMLAPFEVSPGKWLTVIDRALSY
jgi:hypothetical protein